MKKNQIIKIASFFIIYVLIFTVLYWYFYIDKENRINVYLQQQIEKLKSEYKATKNTYEKLSNFVYDELISDKKFLDLLDKRQSQKLLNYLLPYYTLLKKYNIYYLSIDLPDGKNFINMNKQNINKQISKNIFNTKSEKNHLVIEFQRPIYNKTKLLGIFRSAINYNVFRHELQNLFGGYYEFILNSKYINKNIFHYGTYLFIQSEFHPRYYYEEISEEGYKISKKNIAHLINLKLKRQIKDKIDLKNNFALIANVNDNYYIATFLVIQIYNDQVGYLISYKKDDTIALFEIVFLQNVLFGSILVLILLSFVYYFLHIRHKFEQMAISDKLTGLYNRHKFYEIVQQELVRSQRNKKPFSIILFDIDHFKKINDKFGHDIGDYVLKEIAQIVKKTIRKTDIIFRWGGEEFLILSPETDSDGAYMFAEKIRESISNHEFDQVGQVTISIGIAQYQPQRDKNIDDVIKRADTALYQSKNNGRNQTTIAL